MAGQLSKLVRDLHGLHTHASRQTQGQRPPPPLSNCHTTACLLSTGKSAVQQRHSKMTAALHYLLAHTSRQAHGRRVFRGLSSALLPEITVWCAPHIVHGRAALHAWRNRASDTLQ